jgi:hypothetical protein
MRVVLRRHDAVEDIDNIQLRHGGNLRADRFFRNGDLLGTASSGVSRAELLFVQLDIKRSS